MNALQESEVLNLILGTALVLGLIMTLGIPGNRVLRRVTLGLVAILGSYVCTNLEAILWHDVLNLVEHLLLATGSVFFVLAALAARRESGISYDD